MPALISMEDALAHWPDVRLAPDVAFFLRRGQAVFVSHAPAYGLVRIFTREDRFLGIGHVLEDGRVAPNAWWNCMKGPPGGRSCGFSCRAAGNTSL